MSESTRKKIVFGLLVAAMIWGAYNLTPGKKSSFAGAGASAPAAAAVSQTPRASTGIKMEQERQRGWGEDPFRVIVAQERRQRGVPSWNLGGIIYNASSPLAIINNQTVGVGDVVGGATVVTIDRTKVTLDHNGSPVTLKVSSKG